MGVIQGVRLLGAYEITPMNKPTVCSNLNLSLKNKIPIPQTVIMFAIAMIGNSTDAFSVAD